jgi:hypothetical protein
MAMHLGQAGPANGTAFRADRNELPVGFDFPLGLGSRRADLEGGPTGEREPEKVEQIEAG